MEYGIVLALTSQEMWGIGIIASIVAGILAWLVGMLYASNRTFLSNQFETVNAKHAEHGGKLDGIKVTIGEVQVELQKLDGDKISWKEFRGVKDDMEDDRQKDVSLALAVHVEKHH